MITEERDRMMNFEDGGRDHMPRNISSHWNLKMSREGILFSEPTEKNLDFSPVQLISDF